MIDESKTDPFDMKIPSLGLEVKKMKTSAGSRMMLLRPLKTAKRNFRGKETEMILYETFNYFMGEIGYWSGWLPK